MQHAANQISATGGICGKAHKYIIGECLACRVEELEKALRLITDLDLFQTARAKAIARIALGKEGEQR